jgi:poly(A) polymerase
MTLPNFLKNIFSSPPKTVYLDPEKSNNLNTDANATHIVKTLQKKGFQSYLVGGCIRDALINIIPKDFDIATEAKPEEVKSAIRSARIIGKRFKLVHVYMGRQIYEVATFRSSKVNKELNPKIHSTSTSGRILRDNVYGNQTEDAARRDFTVNAMYYDPSSNCIIDYYQGLKDIKNKKIRFIGDPKTRITEDPVRMLRAIRIANKLNFKIDNNLKNLLKPMSNLLADIPAARLLEEYQKIFLSGKGCQNFKDLREYGLMQHFFPLVEKHLKKSPDLINYFYKACNNTDKRINKSLGINPAFLISIFLWSEFKEQLISIYKNIPKMPKQEAAVNAIDKTLRIQRETVTLTQRISQHVKEIWLLQYDLEKCNDKTTKEVASHPRFRAAYDFLIMRQGIDGVAQKSIDFWRPHQAATEQSRQHKYNRNNRFKRRSNMKPDQTSRQNPGRSHDSKHQKKPNN